ncbi:MAG: SCO family protein [Gammaproteobacteria bacterium]
MNSSRKWFFAAAAVVALGAGIALGLARAPQPAQTVATVFDAPRVLPAVQLLDENGTSRNTESLSGSWSWVFYGFVSCPDVCPATLGIIASAMKDIPPAVRPSVYLVSVDPERDVPDVLAPYVRYFDPDFHALTGSVDQIETLAGSMYAAFAKVPLESGGYTMDHFSGIYFLNAQAQVVAVSTSPHLPGQLAADYLAIRNP